MEPRTEETQSCVNWLRFDAIRETVAENEKRYGTPDDSIEYDLSEANLIRNCMECNMRPKLTPNIETLSQIAGLFKDPIIAKLESVGMKRKCYKAP